MLALTGLLVPVAIHLWNRRPGREVAVGSLRWLAAGANRRLRNLKPEQLWLLLLRAALLAVLALAVAGPVWQQRQPTSRGVVLLSPEALGAPALAALRPTIDSLRRRGYALRWLAKGFARVPGAAWRTNTSSWRGTAGDSAALPEATRFAWARVQLAADAFPGQPLFVVTTAALRDFQGAHPPLPATVTWQALPAASPKTWLQAAALRGNQDDSLQLLLGLSTETQTTFRTKTLAYNNQRTEQIRVSGLAPLRVETLTDGTQALAPVPVNATLQSTAPISLEAKSLDIKIYSTPEYASDARYLQAALRAAATGFAIPPLIKAVAVPPVPSPGSWLFWLAAEPLPPAWRAAVRHGARVWQEAAGPGVADTAQLTTNGTASTVFRREAKVGITAAGFPLWVDSQGRDVLTREPLGTGGIYHLITRLHPAWSTLAENPELPACLLTLLQPTSTDDDAPAIKTPAQQLARYDQRTLDPAQLAVGSAPQPADLAQRQGGLPAFHVTDLRPWLVLLAGLLFVFERLLAHRRAGRALSSIAS